MGITKRIYDNKGLMSIKDLSLSELYNESHLNRLFYQYIGMNVKLYSRIVRINSAINQMSHFSNETLKYGLHWRGFFLCNRTILKLIGLKKGYNYKKPRFSIIF